MMRDLRIPIVLVIPVSIALIGVLWILKKRSGPKDDSRKKLAKPKAEAASIENTVEQTKQIDNEGITVTQRKIPETLARDRGSADLNCTGPDIIAGAETREISGGARDISEAVEQKPLDHEIHAITSISINSRDCKQISLSEKERPKSPLEDRTQNNSVLDVVELQNFQLENLLSGAKDSLTNSDTVLPEISHRHSESLDLQPDTVSDFKAVTVSEDLKSDLDNALINTLEVFELAHESDPNISQSTAVVCEPVSELKSYKDIELDELKDSSIFSDDIENKEKMVDDIENKENAVTILEGKHLEDALNFSHIHQDKLSAVLSFEEVETQPQPVQQSTPVPNARESAACLSSERTCEYKVVEEVLFCKDQDSGHDVSPLVGQKVESGHDLVLISTDASTELMAFHVNTLSENVSPNYFKNPVNSCDNPAVADVEDVSHLDSSELAICDQSSYPACLSSTKDVTSDCLLIDSVSIGEVHTTNENWCDADHSSFGDLVAIRDTSKGTLPCERYSVRSSSPPTLASTLNLQNLSTLDPCTDYKINWSSETAADEPLLTDSVITVSDSSFSSIQPLPENMSLSQGLISPDLGVETSELLQPIDIVDNNNLASNDHKAGSPTKSNSPMCDNNSEGSNDSGRGGSEHDVAGHSGETLVHFDFNMPSELCGRFIGKQGKNINFLKSKTGANVSLINNPYTAEYQICQVVGTQVEVDDALAMIRRKFPLNEFPLLTMLPINVNPVVPAPIVEHPLIVPEVMQLSLPEGVSVEVFVSAIVDAGHIFVQQPTHRSFMSLEKLTYFLNTVYGQDPNVPCVPTPVEYGIICVCENDGCWYRAMIMGPENEDGETQVKFVDYGGYAVLPVSSLKQIRTDFMSLPFQAVECFMANITPNQGEAFFSEEATMTLSSMTEYKLLQCQVVARTENGIPYIHLYQINPESNSAVMINRALVNGQYVRWIEIL
ncbi:A-kinase anchor protein 1 mitochondrial [Biomphalaria pfeifferi]|uniref:A-kinase anchor protein 1 mitochondrial n=1 Tax=Biomphalaria pfeifferi TaxID=112525 RepID=A0AAD8ASF0_BIOPF|nr:A-kinase anchor protein 1 mitochondrial [Biomphalaria pfeifferi]